MVMPTSRVLKGSLKLLKDISEVCWGTPQDYAKLLTNILGIEFPIIGNEDFVVYGFQVPSADSKGKLWVKIDKANHFAGFFIFVEGKWQRVYNYSIHDVIWKSGDSRSIEDGGSLDPGFQVIDGSVASIDASVQTHIMTFYHENVAATASFGSTVWDYYATIYLGV